MGCEQQARRGHGAGRRFRVQQRCSDAAILFLRQRFNPPSTGYGCNMKLVHGMNRLGAGIRTIRYIRNPVGKTRL